MKGLEQIKADERALDLAKRNKRILSAVSNKFFGALDDEDWSTAPLALAEPRSSFQTTSVVKAGDGGLWVPIYVYVANEEIK